LANISQYLDKKLGCRWQTMQGICGNAMAWLTS